MSRAVVHKPVPRHLTNHGARFIEHWEGFLHCPYQDMAGVWTIGIGSTYDKHGNPVTQNTPCISVPEARRLLKATTQDLAQLINATVHHGLNVNEADALISLGYNIGSAGLADSTVVREINNGNRHAAADAFMMWNKATINGSLQVVKGLDNRRKAERALFLRPPRHKKRR